MIKPDFKSAFKLLVATFSEANIPWAIIGSANMALQGISVTPNDLDLVVLIEHLPQIEQQLSAYVVSSIQPLATSQPNHMSWELSLNIAGVVVQVLGETSAGVYGQKLQQQQVCQIQLAELTVWGLSLAAEAEAYTQTNRLPKAQLIQAYLQNYQTED